jgi:glycosyltransferase involved in cell wall biosynthesis
LTGFGWKPIVITVRPESLPQYSVDPALDEWAPSGIVVRRTTLFRPISNAKSIFSELLRREPKSSGNSASRSNPSNQSASRADRSRETTWAKRVIRLCLEPFSTPDTEVGWIMPAVNAGVDLVRKHRPNVLYSTGPPHSSHLIALIVKALTGIPLVIDFRDPWTRCDWVLESGLFRDRVNCWLESLCVKYSDFIIVNTSALRRKFLDEYENSFHNKIVVLPNGYDPALRDRVAALLRKQAPAPRNGQLRLCHPGTVYGPRKLQPLIAAIDGLKESNVPIVLEQIGLVEAESTLADELRRRHLDGVVTLLGQQPHAVTLQRMAVADAFVLIQPKTTLQVPGKLFEMLPFQKPILAITGQGETAELVAKYDLGLVAAPDCGDAIMLAIKQLAHQISVNHAFGWREALDAFDGRKLTGQLAAVFNQACGYQAQ